jgi:acetolactate synthase-1/2/3 large subunit
MFMKASQVVVEMLKAYDVRYVFGLPGDTSMALYEALYDARSEITHVLARDERSAAFMADVYARVSSRPGVCEAPSGGGATYVLPGVAEAHGSSVAFVLLTTDVPLEGEGRGQLMALDQETIFGPVTKWNTLVKRADKIPETLRKAFRIATSGRPGAVHIVLPQDILEEEVKDPALYGEAECHLYPSYRTRPDETAVEKAAGLLIGAHSPVIVAGGGAVISQAWQEVTALAETLAIPVGTSINGKGSIAENHPLSLGVVGGNGGRGYGNRVVADADLILYVGCKTDSVTTRRWTLPPQSSDKAIIHVDVDPSEIGNNYPTAVGLVGDAKMALRDLLQALEAKGANRSWQTSPRVKEISAQAQAWWQAFEAKAAASSSPVKPQRVTKELAHVLPPDSIVVADAGTPTPFTAACCQTSQAGRRVIIPRAHGGLGYAIPGVVGAKLARPEATVVGLFGDGSFGMSAGDLETISRLGLPVTLIQFTNGSFGWIKIVQKLYRGGKYLSVDLSPDTDHVAIARGFGLRALRVERSDNLGDVLREAIQSDQPSFVEIVSEPEHEECPPVAKWLEDISRDSE